MQKHIKRGALQLVAVLCLIAGIAGLVLPFIQGVLLLVLGLVLISVSTPSVRHHIEKLTHRHPHIKALHLKLERFVLGIVGEL